MEIGDAQEAQGDLAGALKSFRESLAIRERLAQSDPGNAGWQRDLSISMSKVGNVQLAQGDLAGALKSYRDSLAIFERLAQSNPGNTRWQRDLSVAIEKLDNLAYRLVLAGDFTQGSMSLTKLSRSRRRRYGSMQTARMLSCCSDASRTRLSFIFASVGPRRHRRHPGKHACSKISQNCGKQD
jgi:tetratricopeptide (TPR) repeat protein